jgi:hypothetical protein
MNQQLLLRGNRDFESIEDYWEYLQKIFKKLNSNVKVEFEEEVKCLKALPS